MTITRNGRCDSAKGMHDTKELNNFQFYWRFRRIQFYLFIYFCLWLLLHLQRVEEGDFAANFFSWGFYLFIFFFCHHQDFHFVLGLGREQLKFLHCSAEALISIVGSRWAEIYDLPVCTTALNEWQISEGEGKIAWLKHRVKQVKWLMTNRWDFYTVCMC